MSANYIFSLSCFFSNTEVFYDEALNVAKDIETDVVTYSVPAGQTFIVTGGSASAKTDTDFKFYIDGSIQSQKRLAWTDRDIDFRFTKNVTATKEIKITAEHGSLTLHDFNASIWGILQ